MSDKPSTIKVAMIKRVAEAWLLENAHPEHRITVYASFEEMKTLPTILRYSRDGKTRRASLPNIPDLGIQVGYDHMTVWSKDRLALIKLDRWFAKKGLETTGIW